MNKKRRKRIMNDLTKKLKIVKKKQREALIKRAAISTEMDRLKVLIDECDAFKPVSDKQIEEENMKVEDVRGVYICQAHEGDDVVIKHFFNLVREEFADRKKCKEDTIVLKGILKQKLVNEHGEPTDLSPGRLVFVSYKQVEKGYGFHVVNVEPKSPESITQYQYALSKMGMALEPVFNHDILADDGQFRELLTKKGYDA